ncbi:MAG: ATP synthase F1 subunit delta [Planctomycetaceae bacterium]|nr:ATP synthase F1 subunit delta [Planctomycetaceae bacterium]
MSEVSSATCPSHVLEDPSAKAVARVYALAYLDAAASANVSDPLEELQSFHDDVLVPHPEFERLLTSQFTSRDDKQGIIDRVVKPRASEFFVRFLHVLAEHDRLDLLPAIYAEAQTEYETRSGQKRVTVKSAIALSESQVQSIADRLNAALPFEPIVETEVDESLLGGLVIQVGDTVYDSSLKSRLKSLQHRLRERYLHEIQSGRDRFSHSEGN